MTKSVESKYNLGKFGRFLRIADRVILLIVSTIVFGWIGVILSVVVTSFKQLVVILLEATLTLIDTQKVGEAFLGFFIALIFSLGIGAFLVTTLTKDQDLNNQLSQEFCQNLKMVSIRSTLNSIHSGWLFGRNQDQTFLREKVDEETYENVVFQNSAIALTMDMSSVSFKPEKSEAFPKCLAN